MTNETSIVVFVCEHGSAKSTIAAAHFNKVASDRKLNARAISRGTDPDETYPPHVTAGLGADGLLAEESRPKKLSKDDIAKAVRVVVFSQMQDEYLRDRPVDDWSDVPPVSEGYEIARDEIVKRVRSITDAFYPSN